MVTIVMPNEVRARISANELSVVTGSRQISTNASVLDVSSLLLVHMRKSPQIVSFTRPIPAFVAGVGMNMSNTLFGELISLA